MLTKRIETAVILAATDGMRMRPFTKYVPKVLLPLGEKPMIVCHLDRLEQIGIQHIIVTLEPRIGGMIKDAIEKGWDGKSTVTFLFQEERRGLGYALLCCADYVEQKSFLLLFADEYTESGNIFKIIRKGAHTCFDGLIGICKESTEHIRATASVEINQTEGIVTRYVEKPSLDQVSGQMGTSGVYLFNNQYYDALVSLQHDKTLYIKGEFSIGCAIQLLIKKGLRVGYVEETGRHIHFTCLRNFFDYYHL